MAPASIQPFLDQLIARATQHPLTTWQTVSLLISAAATVRTIIGLMTARTHASRLLDAAGKQLKLHIAKRVSQPELMAPSALRGLARNIQTEMKCPPITDGMICEAIRLVALEFEQTYKGKALLSRIRTLDNALHSVDANAPRMLTIAAYNPVSAFTWSILCSVVTLMACQ